VANALYDKARESFLGQSPALDWDTDTIKVTLIDTGNYTVNLSTHQYMNTNTVAAAAKVGSPQTLGSKTVTAGVADAADVTFSAVSGASVEALIIWKDGGGGGTSTSGTTDLLIAYIDTATGLPVTPNGGDITVSWDNGSSKIFRL
jgi:hypothetical protein